MPHRPWAISLFEAEQNAGALGSVQTLSRLRIRVGVDGLVDLSFSEAIRSALHAAVGPCFDMMASQLASHSAAGASFGVESWSAGLLTLRSQASRSGSHAAVGPCFDI